MIDSRFDIPPSRFDAFGSRNPAYQKGAMNPLSSSEIQQERLRLLNNIKQWFAYQAPEY